MDEDKLKQESYQLMGGMNSKVSTYVNSTAEFRRIVNMNFVNPGALTQRPGTSLYVGATVSGKITGGYEFERLNGASYIVATANTNAYTVTGAGFNAFRTGLTNNALFDFQPMVDRLFAANGYEFFKFDGTNSSRYSLPAPTGASAGPIAGGSIGDGTYSVGYGYLNDRGYYGPISNVTTVTLGAGNNSINYNGMTLPSDYGISAIVLYRSIAGGIATFGSTTIGFTTSFTDTGSSLGVRAAPTNLWFTMAPMYLELYNNQLFMGGFTGAQSTVYWSQIGEPEGVDPTFFAEFRTNDGDRVSGMRSYQGSLVVFKERSFHRITGDNPSNFSLIEISDQYGCISNRASIVYEDIMLFLDPKGICYFDGANTKILSNRVEPVFNSMNVSAARNQAFAIHYRKYNEVWFGIPTGDSTINNTIVVYDYLADAFTTYEGVNISTSFYAKGSTNDKTVFYGGYTGSIGYFGSSFLSDGGAGITCLLESGYHVRDAKTGTALWRRFYADVIQSSLLINATISITFNTNYGTSTAITRYITPTAFQTRVDFGIPAKSIQFVMGYQSATFPLQLNGYAFEARNLRNV